MKNIIIRADSSSSIGTCHIMRDLVLAQKLQSEYENSKIIFTTRELKGDINSKILENKYKIEILKDNSINEFQKVIDKYNPFLIVIDNYDINYEFEKELKQKYPTIKLMVLDDTYEKHYCDILLNHNIYADEKKYKNIVPNNCELICGVKYTLLRNEFIQEKSIKREKIYDIFISYGGADTLNPNIPTLKVLEEVNKDFKIVVVTTTANSNLNELKEYVKDKKNIKLEINTNQIAKLLNQSKLAIVTLSVTMNEVWYLKVPFIAIKTASNQDYMVEFLKSKNYIALKEFNKKDLKEIFTPVLINFTELSLSEKK